MASLSIVGDQAVLKTNMKLDTIKLLEKFDPKALVLRDAEGEVKFGVASSERVNHIPSFGVTFSKASDDGTAFISFPAPPVPEGVQPKQHYAKLFGMVLANLKTVEHQVGAAAADVDRQLSEAAEDINIL